MVCADQILKIFHQLFPPSPVEIERDTYIQTIRLETLVWRFHPIVSPLHWAL